MYITAPDGIHLIMGNEALARGAMEAGVNVAAGYPGTPSSEIIETLAFVSKKRKMYVEWSINEKVALEVCAAASFAGLRSVCAMKQNGVNVASDFLLHLAESGTRGGIVLVSCDDPGAFSSMNEEDSRFFAQLLEIPLLEPGTFQQAKDVMTWAFDLSEQLKSIVMVRSATRLSHASGNVEFGPLPHKEVTAVFAHEGGLEDTDAGPVTCAPVVYKHKCQQEKMKKAQKIFDVCPFNQYTGPEFCDLLIVTSGVCSLYSKEAVSELDLGKRVGILSLTTTWPLPPIKKYLKRTKAVLVVEEILPFLEEHVKARAAELAPEIGVKSFYGKSDGTLPAAGELTPDTVIGALSNVLKISYPGHVTKLPGPPAPQREVTFCPGCPHRASFWSIHTVLALDNRKGFVCGDIGCYTMDIFSRFRTLKTIHSMGSGLGLASGFGKLHTFGMDQPVVAVCGDSTFFHATVPALINAVHNASDIVLVVLDNGGTAMTGFQAHPGLPVDAVGEKVPAVDIAAVCEAVGAQVTVVDPFDLEGTQKILLKMIQDSQGVNVLILRQICSLSPERKKEKKYTMYVDEEMCIGEGCGCNRLCTRVFCCPGLVWDEKRKIAKIDDVICTGCGVCAGICPVGAIVRQDIQEG
jgi:indolepyruvate ferredoxin oxidoreductase alpha subunit